MFLFLATAKQHAIIGELDNFWVIVWGIILLIAGIVGLVVMIKRIILEYKIWSQKHLVREEKDE
jgi:hypothetical protein